MQKNTCCLPDCDVARYQSRDMCASHYMKNWRYGSPYFKQQIRFADLTGERFGMLVAQRRTDSGTWECICDCGKASIVRIGDLNRGTANSCGDRAHTRKDTADYGAIHCRLKAERGPARRYSCADCGGAASHWSYDHTDPDERTAQLGIAQGLPYSMSTSHYQPRCVPCHKAFDLGRAHHAA